MISSESLQESTDDSTLVLNSVPQVTLLDDGTKIIVEYKLNDQGQQVKVTRKIKTTVQKYKANHAIAERKRLMKFGDSKGLHAGPDSNSTTFGDQVFLKMTQGIKARTFIDILIQGSGSCE